MAGSKHSKDPRRSVYWWGSQPVGERFLEDYGIKKSSVSRRYIRAIKERMKELLERAPSTNVIEFSFSLVGSIMDRVKRWRDEGMEQGWVTVLLLEGKKRFKRGKGYREIPRLIVAIDRKIAGGGFDRIKDVA